jgi:heterodisulfide reductase subunit B
MGAQRTYAYFPGCTVRAQAAHFERPAVATARALGIDLVELTDWQCCGAVFPLVTDNLMPLLSPARSLIAAAGQGRDLVTLCSSCYNVLKRTNHLMRTDEEKRGKLNAFLEAGYDGGARALHLLEALAEAAGGGGTTKVDARAGDGGGAASAGTHGAGRFGALAAKVVTPLTGLKTASYYGCMLLRPPDAMAFDDVENPSVMEEFARALGASPVDFPYRAECCGAYLAITGDTACAAAVRGILDNAAERGAEVIVTSCPLCLYNLESPQATIAARDPEFRPIPVVYFAQLSALALGCGDTCGWERHEVDPRPVLERFGAAPGASPARGGNS